MARKILTRKQKEERALDAIIACSLRDDLPPDFWQKVFEKMDAMKARETGTVAAPIGSQPDSVVHHRLVRTRDYTRDQLLELIGYPPEGAHCDEWLPRGE